jgi:hypothetical protein
MMPLAALVLPLLLLLPPDAPATADAAGFVDLFNGRDLAGWEGLPGWWSVKDGALTAESTPERPCPRAHYLFWRGGEPGDFELIAEYRLRGGNSGIQFRSREIADFDLRGYQADCEAGDQWTGCLFEHARGGVAMRGEDVTIAADGTRTVKPLGDPATLLKAVHKDGWNEYRIIARGPEITLAINGVTMCRAADRQAGAAAAKGVIALQMHPGPPMKIEFRKVRLKSLEPPAAR